MGVGITYAGGGYGAKEFGSPIYIGIAFLVLVSIVLISRFVRGFIGNISVLVGISIGFALTAALGMVNFSGLSEAAWFAPVFPFHFGMPKFDILAIASMTLVMIVTLIESMGGIFAMGEIIDKKPTENDVKRGLRTDGLGALIGGIFNTFPYTTFSQNIGLVDVSGVRSRFVCVAAGVMMICLLYTSDAADE